MRRSQTQPISLCSWSQGCCAEVVSTFNRNLSRNEQAILTVSASSNPTIVAPAKSGSPAEAEQSSKNTATLAHELPGCRQSSLLHFPFSLCQSYPNLQTPLTLVLARNHRHGGVDTSDQAAHAQRHPILYSSSLPEFVHLLITSPRSSPALLSRHCGL